ncbi:MAG: GNAT family N-acetyltransferase [Candidatus Hermodarchaeota archaeon]
MKPDTNDQKRLRSVLEINENRLIRLKPYQKADRSAIIQICHATGYMGEDATLYFFDRKLFALMHALYYTDYEPENCFVAEVDGKVIGYIIGTKDTVRQRRRFVLRVSWKIILHILFYTSVRYQRDIKSIFRILYQRLRRRNPTLYYSTFDQRKTVNTQKKLEFDWRLNRFQSIVNSFELLSSSLSEEEIIRQYPAHLHINLLKDAQGLGLGSQLLRAFEAHLVAHIIRGYHLRTTDYNYKAIPFYFKNSLSLLSVKVTSFSWPNVLTRSLIFGKKLQDIDLSYRLNLE